MRQFSILIVVTSLNVDELIVEY